jgi:hypothetical protein
MGHRTRPPSAFRGGLESALLDAPGAEEWDDGEVLRSIDGARVVLIGRAAMPTDVAMLSGSTFAQPLIDRVDHTGARILEARALEPASS